MFSPHGLLQQIWNHFTMMGTMDMNWLDDSSYGDRNENEEHCARLNHQCKKGGKRVLPPWDDLQCNQLFWTRGDSLILQYADLPEGSSRGGTGAHWIGQSNEMGDLDEERDSYWWVWTARWRCLSLTFCHLEWWERDYDWPEDPGRYIVCRGRFQKTKGGKQRNIGPAKNKSSSGSHLPLGGIALPLFKRPVNSATKLIFPLAYVNLHKTHILSST